MEVAEIRERLKRLRVTQDALAGHLSMNKGDLSKYLSGKLRMRLDTFRAIEAFLANAERKAQTRGVAESAPAPFAHQHAPKRFITLEEARALKANPPPKLPLEERERIIRELMELGDAYRALAGQNTQSEDDILGYGDDGLPTQ